MSIFRLLISLLLLNSLDAYSLRIPNESDNKLLRELTVSGVQTINEELSKGYSEFQMNGDDKHNQNFEAELQNHMHTVQERNATRLFFLNKLSRQLETLKYTNETCFNSVIHSYRDGCMPCLVERCDKTYEQLQCQEETGIPLASFSRVLRRSLAEDITRVAEETTSAWLQPINLENIISLIEDARTTYTETSDFFSNSSEVLFEFTNKFHDRWTGGIKSVMENVENLIDLGSAVTDDVSDWFNTTSSKLEGVWAKRAEVFSKRMDETGDRIESWWNASQIEIEQTVDDLEDSALTFFDSIFATAKDLFMNLASSFTSALWNNQESEFIGQDEIENRRTEDAIILIQRRSVSQEVDQFVCENDPKETCVSVFSQYCSECAEERLLQNCQNIIRTQRQLNRVLEDTRDATTRYGQAIQDVEDYVRQSGKKYEWIVNMLDLPQSQRAYKVLQIGGDIQRPKITVVLFGEKPFTFELDEPIENKIDVDNLGSRIALNSLEEYSKLAR